MNKLNCAILVEYTRNMCEIFAHCPPDTSVTFHIAVQILQDPNNEENVLLNTRVNDAFIILSQYTDGAPVLLVISLQNSYVLVKRHSKSIK